MNSVGPMPIPENEPVWKQRRGNDYEAIELTKATEVAPGEYPVMAGQGATTNQIYDIIAQVTADMARARLDTLATTQYVHDP